MYLYQLFITHSTSFDPFGTRWHYVIVNKKSSKLTKALCVVLIILNVFLTGIIEFSMVTSAKSKGASA